MPREESNDDCAQAEHPASAQPETADATALAGTAEAASAADPAIEATAMIENAVRITSTRAINEPEQRELEAEILATAARGDTARLRELQERYRSSRTMLTADERGMPISRAIVVGSSLSPVGAVGAVIHPAPPPAGEPLRVRDPGPGARAIVRIGDAVRERIDAELAAAYGRYEVGGWLFREAAQDRIRLTWASDAGANARAWRTGIDFNLRDRRELEEDFVRLDNGFRRAGLWHSHTRDGDDEPSQSDLDAWRGGFAVLEQRDARAVYVAIIAKGGPSTRLHGFVVRRDPITRQVTCELAEVQEDW